MREYKIVRFMQSSPQDVHVDVPMAESKKKKKKDLRAGMKYASPDEVQLNKDGTKVEMTYEEMLDDIEFLERLGKEMYNLKFSKPLGKKVDAYRGRGTGSNKELNSIGRNMRAMIGGKGVKKVDL
jgi:hypothetical protein